MGVRTGAEFLAGLQDNREVWLGDKRVTDVTAHPACRGAIESLARLYDLQHEPAYREVLTYPAPTTGDAVGLAFLIPRTREDLVRRLGAGGLMQLPASSAAFDSPIGQDLEKYYRGARISAREKVALFKLARDLLGSDFGSRHTLYELYYAGDPSMLMAGFHREFDKAACVGRVKEFLAQPAGPVH